jgi:hypothetical protein
MGVFDGAFGKSGCLVWSFCGEVVVNCTVDRGSRMVVCAGPKIFHFFLNISVEISRSWF